MFEDCLGRSTLAGNRADHGMDALAIFGIGYSNDRALSHGGVAVEDQLNLLGVDVDAAADDQVVAAVADIKIALLVDMTKVAISAQTRAALWRSRRSGILEIGEWHAAGEIDQ